MYGKTKVARKQMERERKTHELKCWKVAFEAIREGTKVFEWRFNDRDFQVGDTLFLREYWITDGIGQYTGRELHRVVHFILQGEFGMPEGYVIMSIPSMLSEQWKC